MNFQKYIILSLFVFSYECMAITRAQKRFENNLKRLSQEDLCQRLQCAEAALAHAQEENNTLKRSIDRARKKELVTRKQELVKGSSIGDKLRVCRELRQLLEGLNDLPQSASSFMRVDAAKKTLDGIEQQIAELNGQMAELSSALTRLESDNML